MKNVLLAILALLLLATGTALADIQATGDGPTKEQALVTAQRRAVEQGVGVFIKSSTTVVDAQLVDDKILSHSRGYVSGYRIVKERKTEDGYSVTISARVDNKSIKNDIDSLIIMRKSAGNPRILVAFSSEGENAGAFKDKDFIDEIYNGIVESLTDRQFRVVDRATAEKFAGQVAATHGIDANLNQAAAFGLKYNADYTLLYGVAGEVREGAVNIGVTLRIKARLIDNTRSQVVTAKAVEQAGSGQSLDAILQKTGRDGGKKIVTPMIEVIQKNWMDAQQNGQIYTVIMDGVEDPEEVAKFTDMLEKFPLVNEARELESGGGKATFEATYRGKRDQLDRDVIRATRELGWNIRKIRAEGARSTWKKL